MKLSLLILPLILLFPLNLIFAQSGQVTIKNDKYGIVDLRNKTPLTDFIYEDIEILRGLGYLVMQNDKIGLLDKNAKKVLDCTYQDIFQILDNPNYVVTENDKGLHSVYGIKERKNVLSGFVADLYNPVSGPYDERSGMVIKTVVIISKNGKKTLLELPKKYLLPLQYDEIVPCISKPGLVLMKKQNKYYVYNVKSRIFSTPGFELHPEDEKNLIQKNTCRLSVSDYFPAKVSGKWGLMNILGKFSLSAKYADIRTSPYVSDRKKAVTVLKLGTKWYVYYAGQIKPVDIQYFLGFWYNYAVAFINEKVLFYNAHGTKLLEIRLKNQTDDKVKAFKKEGKYGLVNYKSRLLLDFEYQDIKVEKNQVFAKKNNKYALFDAGGKAITTFKYDELRLGSAKDQIIIFKQYGKYGLMDFTGNEFVKPKFTYISSFKNGRAEVKVYKTAYRIDTKGNKVE